MKRSIFMAVVATAVVLWAGVVSAQKGQGPEGPKTQSAPKTHVTKTAGPTTTKPASAQGPKTTRGVAAKTGTKTKGPKTTTVSKTTKTTTRPVKTTSKPTKATTTTSKRTKATKTTTTTTTSNTKPEKTTTTTTTTTTTLTPVQQKLQKSTNLADKLQDRLPKGTDLMAAAEGFRSLGEFVSTVNASKNLGLSFEQLKNLRLEEGFSLGQAIQKAKQDTDSTVEARRATTEADRMIAASEEETRKKQRANAPKTRPGSGS